MTYLNCSFQWNFRRCPWWSVRSCWGGTTTARSTRPVTHECLCRRFEPHQWWKLLVFLHSNKEKFILLLLLCHQHMYTVFRWPVLSFYEDAKITNVSVMNGIYANNHNWGRPFQNNSDIEQLEVAIISLTIAYQEIYQPADFLLAKALFWHLKLKQNHQQ